VWGQASKQVLTLGAPISGRLRLLTSFPPDSLIVAVVAVQINGMDCPNCPKNTDKRRIFVEDERQFLLFEGKSRPAGRIRGGVVRLLVVFI
jgi:hypothetical protein